MFNNSKIKKDIRMNGMFIEEISDKRSYGEFKENLEDIVAKLERFGLSDVNYALSQLETEASYLLEMHFTLPFLRKELLMNINYKQEDANVRYEYELSTKKNYLTERQTAWLLDYFMEIIHSSKKKTLNGLKKTIMLCKEIGPGDLIHS